MKRTRNNTHFDEAGVSQQKPRERQFKRKQSFSQELPANHSRPSSSEPKVGLKRWWGTDKKTNKSSNSTDWSD